MLLPPAFDFIKKKFIKSENDTVEATANSLATTNPEILPDYVRSMGDLKDSGVRWYNRDVIGNPSQIIVDIRAGIRPIVVMAGLLALLASGGPYFDLDPGTRIFFEGVIGSWFGTRFSRS
jgi:hypothetical protein